MPERFDPSLPPADPSAGPYDEDGDCAYCGNRRGKHHAPWCEWQDAVDGVPFL